MPEMRFKLIDPYQANLSILGCINISKIQFFKVFGRNHGKIDKSETYGCLLARILHEGFGF